MTDKIYTTTTEIERARVLWERAVFLTQYSKDHQRMMLYQLHDVYLEVIWHMHFNVVLKVVTFTDATHLDPYLEFISLEGVLD